MCIFLPILLLWEKANKRSIVLCNSRLHKPLGRNGKFAGSYATLPIYYSSFLRWRQKSISIKTPTPAKTGPHFWAERRAEIANDGFNISCWQALGACIKFDPEVSSRWSLGPARRAKSLNDPLIKAYIIHFPMGDLLSSVLNSFFFQSHHFSLPRLESVDAHKIHTGNKTCKRGSHYLLAGFLVDTWSFWAIHCGQEQLYTFSDNRQAYER